MLYRRHPYINKRNTNSDIKNRPGYENPPDSQSNANVDRGTKTLTPKERVEIPLPNQAENVKISVRKAELTQRSSFIDIIKDRIHIEEIILIGLIILFLKEGIEDELITILLIYILLG